MTDGARHIVRQPDPEPAFARWLRLTRLGLVVSGLVFLCVLCLLWLLSGLSRPSLMALCTSFMMGWYLLWAALMLLAAIFGGRRPRGTPLGRIRSPFGWLGSAIALAGAMLLAVTLPTVLGLLRAGDGTAPAIAASPPVFWGLWLTVGGVAMAVRGRIATVKAPGRTLSDLMLFWAGVSFAAFLLTALYLQIAGPGALQAAERAELAARPVPPVEIFARIGAHLVTGALFLVWAMRAIDVYANEPRPIWAPPPRSQEELEARDETRRDAEREFRWSMLVLLGLGAISWVLLYLAPGPSSGLAQIGDVLILIMFLTPLSGSIFKRLKGPLLEMRSLLQRSSWSRLPGGARLGYLLAAAGIVLFALGMFRIGAAIARTGDGWAAFAASPLANGGLILALGGLHLVAFRRGVGQPTAATRTLRETDGEIIMLEWLLVSGPFALLLLFGDPRALFPWTIVDLPEGPKTFHAATYFMMMWNVWIYGLIWLPFRAAGSWLAARHGDERGLPQA